MLWAKALRLGASVLISANALSRWRTDSIGLRHWDGFDGRHLNLVHHHPVALDSAGFTAARRYRGFPWGVDEHLDLAAAAPWLWWAAMDLCVPEQVAWPPPPDAQPRNAVESRIAEAMDHLRQLHEEGEVEWQDVHAAAAFEMAFLDD